MAGRTGESMSEKNGKESGNGGRRQPSSVQGRKRKKERKVTAKETASKEAGGLSESKVRSAGILPHMALAGQVVKKR